MKRSMLTLITVTLLAACGGDETWDTALEENAVNPNPVLEATMPEGLNVMQRAETRLDHMPQLVQERIPDQVQPSDRGPDMLEDDCDATLGCQIWGRCTGDERTGKCVVGSDQDCQGSMFCKNIGACTRTKTESGWRCKAGSDADCQRSHTCRAFNQCSWNPADLTCE